MKLNSIELIQTRKRNKNTKKAVASKKLENVVLIELQEKLEELLFENDRAMIEVNPRVVSEFINILSNKVLSMYDFEQVDKNKFIFYTKEIEI